ncbi:hypothetical protein AVEN_142515-1 [Araneus ventricosus]|uniref:Histone-lysine N-methyltransferase SETMAR n=1 Tax=Araneus ventricosus TaxID=182803 RepID=A0A4Y2CGX9_ARAVE|nr:hypothetical protein AVEN_142515-1 [Araneus ventricosus]
MLHAIATLTKLKSVIRLKSTGLFRRGVLFLDNNARPNTARDTKEHIRRPGWERLDDSAYSPDLSPSDFHLFPALKSALSGRAEAVKNILRTLGTDQRTNEPFYQDGFSKLISQYDKCINVGGEYVKK